MLQEERLFVYVILVDIVLFFTQKNEKKNETT